MLLKDTRSSCREVCGQRQGLRDVCLGRQEVIGERACFTTGVMFIWDMVLLVETGNEGNTAQREKMTD